MAKRIYNRAFRRHPKWFAIPMWIYLIWLSVVLSVYGTNGGNTPHALYWSLSGCGIAVIFLWIILTLRGPKQRK